MICRLKLLICLIAVGCSQNALSAQEDSASPVDRSGELQLISADFGLADGPSWDGWSLTIPDVKGGKLFRYIPAKGELQTLVPDAGKISATFYNHGRLFLSDNVNGEIAFLDGREKVSLAKLKNRDADPSKPDNAKENRPYRPNDLVVDRHGGIYVTLTPQGKVLYIAADGTQSVAVDQIETPNGITLSPDESTLYVSEFVPKKIMAYDVAAPGRTANGRVLAMMDDGPDRGADGMTIDRAGNVYCAGPTDIWIWSPSGKLLDKIACPKKPINCTFGGQQLRTLFITGMGGLYSQPMKICGDSPQPTGLVALEPVASNPAPKNASLPPTDLPESVTANLDQVFATYGDRKMLADVFVPNTIIGPKPCLVVVHGGGWHNGDKTKFRALAIELAKRGYVTAAIEYRLAGEAAFPAGIHDCTAAVRFLRANAEKFEIDPSRIGAVGGSAGGHLVGLMASGGGNPALQGEGGNGDQSAQIQAAIVMAGPMEMLTGSVAERSREFAKETPQAGEKPKSNSNSWLRGTVDEKPDLYRLADAHAQIDEQTCPILFMVGEQDNPARNQPSRDRLTSLGIPTGVKVYANGKHGCWNRLPWFAEMANDMDTFFQQQLR